MKRIMKALAIVSLSMMVMVVSEGQASQRSTRSQNIRTRTSKAQVVYSNRSKSATLARRSVEIKHPQKTKNTATLTRSTKVKSTSRVTVRHKPPAPRVEVIPPRPNVHAVWIPGHWYWDWRLSTWIWLSGYWDMSPMGTVWVPGYWDYDSGFYVWIGGYWVF